MQSAAAISGAAVDGAALGSASLTFTPDRMRAGDYDVAIGTAGSTGLVLQTLLPLALAGGGCFTTVRPSRHTLTNIDTIGRFLDEPIGIDQQADGRHLVTVGRG